MMFHRVPIESFYAHVTALRTVARANGRTFNRRETDDSCASRVVYEVGGIPNAEALKTASGDSVPRYYILK